MFGFVYDVRMTDHKCSRPHPESPERIEAIFSKLQESGLLQNAKQIMAREVTQEELETCHEKRFLQEIRNKMYHMTLNNGGDMFTSSGTLLAARLAAGSSIELADALLKGVITTGFAIIRPPGHHAHCGRAGGFCFYNNIMLAAIHLTNAGKKVYIVDFDLHENDGSANILESARHRNNQLLNMFSIHRWDNGNFYPGNKNGGTGTDRTGRIVRVGYNGSQDDEFYLRACRQVMMPHMTAFQPEIVLVSAGFDGALGDPMEGSRVTRVGYKAMMQLILSICPRVGMFLEGGYGLVSTPNCAKACVEALLGV